MAMLHSSSRQGMRGRSSFTIYDDYEYAEMKIAAIHSGMSLQKFLWNAAIEHTRRTNRRRNRTIPDFMAAQKEADRGGVVDIRAWDHFMCDERTVRQAKRNLTEIQQLVLAKERMMRNAR